MQDLGSVTHAQLLATGKDHPSLKLEAFVRGSWVDFTNLYSSEDLLCYLPFDETSGMTAHDESGNENDGTLYNMEEADHVPGKVNYGLRFDDVNEYVGGINFGGITTYQLTQVYWVKKDALTGIHRICGIAPFACGFNVASIFVHTTTSTGTDNNTPYAPIDMTAGVWHLLMITRETLYENKVKVYLDAELKATGNLVNAANGYMTLGNFQVGKSSQSFDGLIDEVLIYTRKLTEDEGKTLYDLKALYDLRGGNCLKSISMSLGGASMTPNPIGGTWSAMLSNGDSIFHPQHPTSAYKDWLVTGRKIRASVGATYAGTDYLWQRVIGYIDEPRFEEGNQKISVSGADYMKLLADTQFQELDATHPNHWGLSTTFDSWPSDGLLGDEMYTNADAMDTLLEEDDVVGWTPTNCNFVSLIEGSGGSLRVGKMTAPTRPASIINTDIGTNAVAGRTYRVKIKHKIVGGDGTKGIRLQIKQTALIEQRLYFPTDAWKEETLYFVATDTAAVKMKFIFSPVAYTLWLDQFSVWEYKPEEDRYFDLPGADANQKGPYHVTYDDGGGAVPVQQGEGDEGWWVETATGYVFFDRNKSLIDGTGLNNVEVFYYTATHPEDAVARILWFAGLYANEAAAKAALDWDDPGFTIDKIWFKAGTPLLDGIKKICERCDYRFYFTWDGIPTFKAKPSYSDALTDGGLNIWTTATNLTYWTEYKEGTSTINREVTEKVEGDYSCRFDVDASNSQVQIYQMNISLTPLKRRKVIIWYKNSVAGKTFQFYIRNIGNNVYLKEDGTWNVGSYYITLPNSIVWTAYELPFYVHPDYSSYLMLLREKLAASSSFYLDKMSIWREEFTFSDQKHIASFSNYQDKGEIKNRIIIKGLKQSEPVNRDETVSSELVGEAHDDPSIALYGERTLTITNHLFQTQGPLDAKCASILADRKDPKWYTDIKVKWNPAPIGLGDMIGWKERLSPTLELTQRGMVRDIKIDKYVTTYKCEKH